MAALGFRSWSEGPLRRLRASLWCLLSTRFSYNKEREKRVTVLFCDFLKVFNKISLFEPDLCFLFLFFLPCPSADQGLWRCRSWWGRAKHRLHPEKQQIQTLGVRKVHSFCRTWMSEKMGKYLLIIDDAVLLVIRFDSRELYHQVHEVRATFLTLLGNRTTHRKLGNLEGIFFQDLNIYHCKPAHLINHLDFSEGQTVQPVHLHHVALSMCLCELDRAGKEVKGETQFTRLCKMKIGSNAAAELIAAWWLMCKLLNQSCTNPVLSAKPVSCLCTAVSVAVGSLNTHLARNSWPTNHMVRISTQSWCQHTNWERPRTSLMLNQVQKNVKNHSEYFWT